MPDVDVLQAAIASDLPGCDVTVLASVGSTNNWLVERSGQLSGDAFCLALTQVEGRGRRGKSWSSPAGSFSGSASLEIMGSPADIGPFSLAVATSLAQLLEGYGVSGVSLKWPNDVLVNGRKIAGILLELSPAKGAQGQRVVVGVGLNREPVDQDVGQAVTSLAEEISSQPELARLASDLWVALCDCRDRFQQAGFGAFKRAWLDRDALHQREVDVIQGDTRWAGLVLGIGDDGSLRVQTEQGERAVVAGEVSVRLR